MNRFPAEQSKPLQLVNGLLLRYLVRRRLDEMYQGSLQIVERRQECMQLVKWLTEWNPYELTTEFVELKRLFDEAMARIPDPL